MKGIFDMALCFSSQVTSNLTIRLAPTYDHNTSDKRIVMQLYYYRPILEIKIHADSSEHHQTECKGDIPRGESALFCACLFTLTGYTAVWGAVGCDLNDPDRDVARLFPESTGYKTIYTSIQKKGGEKLLATVETRLGDKFHGIYETIDVPYTIYEIFANKKEDRLHTRSKSERPVRGHPGISRPRSRRDDKGLLHTENDKPVCGETA